MANENKAVRELVRFRVNEVSVVDSPAIEKPFAVVKSADGGGVAPVGTTAEVKAEGDADPAQDETPADEGAKRAPVHAALLAEKVQAFKDAVAELFKLVSGMDASDPKALEEQLKQLSEANYRMSDMGWAITSFVRAVPGAVLGKAKGAPALAKAMTAMDASLDAVQKAAAGDNPKMSTPTTPAAKPETPAKPTAKADCPTCKGAGEMDSKPCPDCMADKAADKGADGAEGEGGAVKPGAKPTAKRLTAERLGKLGQAFATLGGVLKDAGVDDLEGLLGLAKENPALAKALGDAGTAGAPDNSTAELRAEIASLKKRLDQRDAAGQSRALGDDGQPVNKSESLFKGVV